MMRHIARIDLDDGLVFEASEATADTIRDDDQYAGIRVSLPGRLDRAVFRFHVDLNFGDPIAPPPAEVEVPRLLGGEPVRMLGYPLVMVLAEKIVTMVERGQANTRWRDFADVYLLTTQRHIDPAAARAAIAVVAGHRGVQMKGLADLTQTYPPLAQPRWSAWRTKQLLEDVLPAQFTDVLLAVSSFVDDLDATPGRGPE
jgi:Nucleotidyl transferase AbiEii toxin, Type IV TA system